MKLQTKAAEEVRRKAAAAERAKVRKAAEPVRKPGQQTRQHGCLGATSATMRLCTTSLRQYCMPGSVPQVAQGQLLEECALGYSLMCMCRCEAEAVRAAHGGAGQAAEGPAGVAAGGAGTQKRRRDPGPQSLNTPPSDERHSGADAVDAANTPQEQRHAVAVMQHTCGVVHVNRSCTMRVAGGDRGRCGGRFSDGGGRGSQPQDRGQQRRAVRV